MMGKQNRLGMLQMGIPGQKNIHVLLRHIQKHLLQPVD
jgi:hypothetical protein